MAFEKMVRSLTRNGFTRMATIVALVFAMLAAPIVSVSAHASTCQDTAQTLDYASNAADRGYARTVSNLADNETEHDMRSARCCAQVCMVCNTILVGKTDDWPPAAVALHCPAIVGLLVGIAVGPPHGPPRS